MIKYFNGDLLESSCNIICHQVNTIGVMGAGIAAQIKSRYPECFQEYKALCNQFRNEQDKLLGKTQFYSISCENIKIIVNFFSQRGLGWDVQTDYQAFKNCCKELKEKLYYYFSANTPQLRIGFPYKIGCGLARGNWDIIKQIIEEEFADDLWNVEIWRFEK